MSANHIYSSGWREQAKTSKKTHPVRRMLKWAPLMVFCSVILSAGLLFFFVAIPWLTDQTGQAGIRSSAMGKASTAKPSPEKPVALELADLDLDLTALSDRLVLERAGESLIVESSIDPALQRYVVDLLQKSNTVKSAVVVMRPSDGRILAMAGYDAEGNGKRLCLEADFPAASLFKIVAAAAALEHAGFTPEKKVYFDGYKYSLYKRQLKQTRGRYTTEMSFKQAFGSSINPVFGKLGIYDLGQQVMTNSAEKFFFNRSIPFDFPVDRSIVNVPEDDFGLAEIASGYNKRTVISPLHAALLASAVANDGVMMRPWMVKRVLREDGQVLYQGGPSRMTDSISRETAEDLRTLMRETVTHGTCRRSFRQLREKKAFSDVELGAKTGTMNDPTGQFKCDWVTAYAISADGADGICVAVLGVHGEKLGIRAGQMGRIIINYYLSSS
jgi:cell division protein FtsI/penicillin-binding protein 2